MHGKTAVFLLSLVGLAIAAPVPAAAPGNAESVALKPRIPEEDYDIYYRPDVAYYPKIYDDDVSKH